MDSIQHQIARNGEKGHNLLITGPPGTGKTYILAEIIDRVLLDGRNVAITSTTGISATVLRDSLTGRVADLPPVTTIHRFCGLSDGRHGKDDLIDLLKYSESHRRHKKNILDVHTLIIDEVSMLSLKMFELIEFIFREMKGNLHPFGGIQVVLAGDFLQLPPVPTPEYGDDGTMLIFSPLMKYFHVQSLSQIHRQSETDLIRAIHEIARGQLSQDTENLIQRLKRPLPPGEPPMKILSRKDDVEILNAQCLMEMTGEEKIYRSNDEGNCSKLSAVKELHLKVGAPVLLTVNLTDFLVNGLRGTVVDMLEDEVIIDFMKYGKITVTRHSFTQYDIHLRKDVGIRRQIPLILGFASTIHKSQGMTLERVEIDCKGIFQYGQLTVAISRAVTKKGLRIQNFRRCHVLPPPKAIIDLSSASQLSFLDSMTCCVESKMDENLTIQEHSSSIEMTAESDSDEEICEEDLIAAMDSLQNVQDEERVSLEERVYVDDFNIPELIRNLKYLNPETEVQKAENDALKCLELNIACAKNFVTFIYRNIVKARDECLINKEQLSNKNIHMFYSKFGDILSSSSYRFHVKELFNTSSVEDFHFNIAYKIAVQVRKSVISEHVEPIKAEVKQFANEKRRKDFEQSNAGVGKIRYIAGWCLPLRNCSN